MANHPLWEQLQVWQSPQYKWVDLSHQISPETPHYHGFDALRIKTLADYDDDAFAAYEYTMVGQYGTHVDVGHHFVKGKRKMPDYRLQEMVMPLCVIDASAQCAANPDYELTVQDVLDWEARYGQIPPEACVAMRSDWCKRDPANFDNHDAAGNAHYPGWTLACLQFLVEQRSVAAIGHEPADTDAPVQQLLTGFLCETYILEHARFQLELLANLDQVPAAGALLFCPFLNIKDGTGFTLRCFAICSADATPV